MVYLRNVQAIPNHHGRRAELLLLQGKHAAAEDALLSNRLVWAAIDLNLRLYNWERALSIAEQSEEALHVQNVLWHRYAFSRAASSHTTPQYNLTFTAVARPAKFS